MRLKLRHKFVIFICSLVMLIVIVVMGVGNYVVTNAIMDNHYHELLKAKDIFLNYQKFRFEKLIVNNQLVSDIPHLKAVVNTPGIDHATIFDSIQNIQKIIQSDLFMVTDKHGKLLASFSQPQRFGDEMLGESAFQNALQGKYYQGFWTTEKGIFQVVANPFTFGDTVVGALMIGYVIDQEMIDELMEMTKFEIAFIQENKLLMTHLEDRGQTPFTNLSLAELEKISFSPSEEIKELEPVSHDAQLDKDTLITTKIIGNETYMLQLVPVGKELRKAYFILGRSLDFELLFYKELQKGLILFGIFLLIVTFGGVVFLSKRFTQPIDVLVEGTRKIAKGDFSTRVKINAKDEFGALGASFNLMAENLKGSLTSIDNLTEVQNRLGAANKQLMANEKQFKNDNQKMAENEQKLKISNEELKQNLRITQSLRDDFDIARKQAEIATVAKGKFLANMSHEIRTPMNAIVGFCDLLQKTSLDKTQKKYTDVLQSSGQMLSSVINGILDFSKLESGKITLEAIDFNLHYLIKDVLDIVSVRIHKENIETSIDIEKEVPQNLNGDPTKLRQTLLNLVSNALKFTSKGKITIIVKREHKQPDQGIFLRFTVKDTGMGIAQDKLGHIFQPFDQADTSTTRKYGGTGLGLSISKAIVEAMGGTIWAESVEGKGSEFIFNIVMKEGASVVEKEVYPLEIKDVAGLKVLIVDDNQISREILKKFCDSLKMEILGVENSGFVILEELKRFYAEKNLPDLILSDIRMEGMSGFELVEKIRANKKYDNIKIISVSSEAFAGQADKARTKGFDGYLSKPFNNSKLVRVVTTVLGDKRKGGQIITHHMAYELGCKGIKMLVVEDNKPNQMLIREYSKELGCKCEFADNGQKAIEKLKKGNTYHLILMDLHMPVMGGNEACRIIRKEISKDIPIIALTAAVLEEDRKDADAAGMNDFLEKPININVMREKIIKYGRKV